MVVICSMKTPKMFNETLMFFHGKSMKSHPNDFFPWKIREISSCNDFFHRKKQAHQKNSCSHPVGRLKSSQLCEGGHGLLHVTQRRILLLGPCWFHRGSSGSIRTAVATHLDYLLYAQDVGNILRSSWDSWDKYIIYIYIYIYEIIWIWICWGDSWWKYVDDYR